MVSSTAGNPPRSYRPLVGDRLGQCTCYQGWWSVLPPPPCPVHGPFLGPYGQWWRCPVSTTITITTTGTNDEQREPPKGEALRPEDV